MNYKTIAKFIKDRRSLTIWDTSSEQWITDGIAACQKLADGLKIARLNFGKNKKGTADEE